MNEINTLESNIKNRSLMATGLIAFFVTVSFLFLMVLYVEQEDDAKTLSIAKNQKLLSQQVTSLAFEHINNLISLKPDSSINISLRDTANSLQNNHQLLSALAEDSDSNVLEGVSSLFNNGKTTLHDQINSYKKNAFLLSETQSIGEEKISIDDYFPQELRKDLLTQLEMVELKIDQNIQQKNRIIIILKVILWLLIMFLLLVVSQLIFKPIVRLIKQNDERLTIVQNQSLELKLALDKHAIVYRISVDKNATVQSVNKRFLDFYCYTEEEIVGGSVFDICSDNYPREFYKNIFDECIKHKYWHGESINKNKFGRELWLDTTIAPLINSDNKIESFIVIQNDMSGIKQTELALNQLHKITSDIDKTLHEKIHDMLKLGKNIFDLPLGLISEIYEEEYKVLYCHPEGEGINSGDIYELSNTFCFHTLKAGNALAFHEAGKSVINTHPCYLTQRLECYIGVPIVVEGMLFGTLNFSGAEPAHRAFTDRELNLIQMFAHWIGSEFTRERNKNVLLAQKSNMEQMAKQARIGTWEVNTVNNIITWSDITKEIHEVESDYLPNLATAINFYKEGCSRDTIQNLVNKSIEDGISYEEELELVTAKGREIWVVVRGKAEFEHGRCTRLFGSFQDITERKTIQQKIDQHSQNMALAADTAGIGIWELNLVTNELKWDDWMYKLYGISPDMFSSAYEAWLKALHPEDKLASSGLLEQAVSARGKFITQFRIIWPNGEVKYIKAAAIVTCDAQQKPITMIGANYDVTELVEKENALIKSKELAEIAVTAKNEFFASMSHEIRTPMNGVIGMLDLVKDSKLDQEQLHRIGIAQQSAKSLLTLINDILDFSKIDANKLELENISFNLRKMIDDVGEAFAQQAQQKNIELIVDLVDVDESLVNGDSNRIRQILTNLLGNALKFTKDGEVTIRVSQQTVTDKQWLIIIEVSDTGIGISKNKLEGLFEAFSQVDASTTREYGGTGLGLAIVKKLCLCMHGSVRVESNEGQGSRFICDLLLDKSTETLSPYPSVSLKGKRILIIDKNQACADTIKRQLFCWDIEAHVMTNGQRALSVLIEQSENPYYDLVLISRQMSDIDSLDFLKTIRKHSKMEHIKVIFMTLMATQNDLAECEQIGLNGYFPKPVTTADLYTSLNCLLDISEQLLVNDQTAEKGPIKFENDTAWIKKVKLLLVEDNRVNQMVAMGVLKKLGIEHCEIAENGKDAIEKLTASDLKKPFTFIFMDCQMPVMDGYQATKLIREGEAGNFYKEIPIVAMTANAMLGDEQKCLSAGMSDYLVKPINQDKILETLKIFMGSHL